MTFFSELKRPIFNAQNVGFIFYDNIVTVGVNPLETELHQILADEYTNYSDFYTAISECEASGLDTTYLIFPGSYTGKYVFSGNAQVVGVANDIQDVTFRCDGRSYGDNSSFVTNNGDCDLSIANVTIRQYNTWDQAVRFYMVRDALMFNCYVVAGGSTYPIYGDRRNSNQRCRSITIKNCQIDRGYSHFVWVDETKTSIIKTRLNNSIYCYQCRNLPWKELDYVTSETEGYGCSNNLLDIIANFNYRYTDQNVDTSTELKTVVHHRNHQSIYTEDNPKFNLSADIPDSDCRYFVYELNTELSFKFKQNDTFSVDVQFDPRPQLHNDINLCLNRGNEYIYTYDKSPCTKYITGSYTFECTHNTIPLDIGLIPLECAGSVYVSQFDGTKLTVSLEHIKQTEFNINVCFNETDGVYDYSLADPLIFEHNLSFDFICQSFSYSFVTGEYSTARILKAVEFKEFLFRIGWELTQFSLSQNCRFSVDHYTGTGIDDIDLIVPQDIYLFDYTESSFPPNPECRMTINGRILIVNNSSGVPDDKWTQYLHFNTLNDAVLYSTHDDVIVLLEGEHTLNTDLLINRRIRITGSGETSTSTIVSLDANVTISAKILIENVKFISTQKRIIVNSLARLVLNGVIIFSNSNGCIESKTDSETWIIHSDLYNALFVDTDLTRVAIDYCQLFDYVDDNNTNIINVGLPYSINYESNIDGHLGAKPTIFKWCYTDQDYFLHGGNLLFDLNLTLALPTFDVIDGSIIECDVKTQEVKYFEVDHYNGSIQGEIIVATPIPLGVINLINGCSVLSRLSTVAHLSADDYDGHQSNTTLFDRPAWNIYILEHTGTELQSSLVIDPSLGYIISREYLNDVIIELELTLAVGADLETVDYFDGFYSNFERFYFTAEFKADAYNASMLEHCLETFPLYTEITIRSIYTSSGSTTDLALFDEMSIDFSNGSQGGQGELEDHPAAIFWFFLMHGWYMLFDLRTAPYHTLAVDFRHKVNILCALDGESYLFTDLRTQRECCIDVDDKDGYYDFSSNEKYNSIFEHYSKVVKVDTTLNISTNFDVGFRDSSHLERPLLYKPVDNNLKGDAYNGSMMGDHYLSDAVLSVNLCVTDFNFNSENILMEMNEEIARCSFFVFTIGSTADITLATFAVLACDNHQGLGDDSRQITEITYYYTTCCDLKYDYISRGCCDNQRFVLTDDGLFQLVHYTSKTFITDVAPSNCAHYLDRKTMCFKSLEEMKEWHINENAIIYTMLDPFGSGREIEERVKYVEETDHETFLKAVLNTEILMSYFGGSIGKDLLQAVGNPSSDIISAYATNAQGVDELMAKLTDTYVSKHNFPIGSLIFENVNSQNLDSYHSLYPSELLISKYENRYKMEGIERLINGETFVQTKTLGNSPAFLVHPALVAHPVLQYREVGEIFEDANVYENNDSMGTPLQNIGFEKCMIPYASNIDRWNTTYYKTTPEMSDGLNSYYNFMNVKSSGTLELVNTDYFTHEQEESVIEAAKNVIREHNYYTRPLYMVSKNTGLYQLLLNYGIAFYNKKELPDNLWFPKYYQGRIYTHPNVKIFNAEDIMDVAEGRSDEINEMIVNYYHIDTAMVMYTYYLNDHSYGAYRSWRLVVITANSRPILPQDNPYRSWRPLYYGWTFTWQG
jgi:hypothetical protein